MPLAGFDLDRYLARIGLDASSLPPPDLSGLIAVQAAQLRAIPFENFDVLLRGAIDVSPAAVFEKLVIRGRGGYCFECNTLLREALGAMGFSARTVLGRVVMNRGDDGPVPPRTHATTEVRLGDRLYAVDCGFGAQTPRGAMRIEADATLDGGWRLLADAEFGWRVVRETPGLPPRDLYVFDQNPVYPADIALGNHWTATHPTSGFTRKVNAVRHTDGGRVAIDGRTLVDRRDGEDAPPRTRPIADAGDLAAVIQDELGISLPLSAEEAERLWLVADTTTEPPSGAGASSPSDARSDINGQ